MRWALPPRPSQRRPVVAGPPGRGAWGAGRGDGKIQHLARLTAQSRALGVATSILSATLGPGCATRPRRPQRRPRRRLS
eukprot:11019661-Alexandrium_andersonii.AAC.1